MESQLVRLDGGGVAERFRRGVRPKLVQLDPGLEHRAAIPAVGLLGRRAVVGLQRVRENPDPHTAVGELLHLRDRLVARDQIGRRDQDLLGGIVRHLAQ